MRKHMESPEKPPKTEEYLVAYDVPADATRLLTFDKSTAENIIHLVRTHGGAYAVFKVIGVEESWKP